MSCLVTVPYVIYRHWMGDQRCWMDSGYVSTWILGVPVGAVILANFLCLVNVIRILRSKLPNIRNSDPFSSMQRLYKQARAVVMLAPIFGIHFILLPMRPTKGTWLEYVYDILSVTSTAFQGRYFTRFIFVWVSISAYSPGTLVAFLLCLFNNEVIFYVSKQWKSIIHKENKIIERLEYRNYYFIII